MRLRLAALYLTGRLTEFDAFTLMREMEDITGTHALETIDFKSVLERAREQWEDHPELERLAREATARVGDKWNPTGDIAYAAEDWALEKIAEYAEEEGIELVSIDEDAEEPNEDETA